MNRAMGVAHEDDDNVKVIVRLRPLSEREEKLGDKEVIRCMPGGATLQILDKKQDRDGRQTASVYKFTRCFDTQVSQAHVFEGSGVMGLIDSALQGFSSTMFAYGQTGSGKTYSIAGDQHAIALAGAYGSNPTDGVVGRACSYLYEKIGDMAGTRVRLTARPSTCSAKCVGTSLSKRLGFD